jgi:hypothetical protein
VKEEDIRRLKNIQVAALLPVFLCLAFFLMTSNIYLLFLFLFLLIIGVLIPWILREILCSHLVLKQALEGLSKQPGSAPSSEDA